MKLKTKLFVALSARALVGGAVAGLSIHKNALDAAAANGACKGTISVDISGEGWNANNEGQRISVYFWENDGEKRNGWGTLEFAEKGQGVVFVNYDLEFTPDQMKAVLYSPYWGDQAGEWDINPWGQDLDWAPKWGESSNINFVANSNVIIAGSYASESFVGCAYVEGKNSDNWEWHTLYDLNQVKMNGDNHVVYYATHTVTKNEEFGIKIFDLFFAWDANTFSEFVTESNWAKEGNNIKYANDTPTTVTVYFDRQAGSVVINESVHAEADEWGEKFLGKGCDATMSSWSTFSSSWSSGLSAEAKALLVGLDYVDETANPTHFFQKAVQRYDLVIKRYTTAKYNDFMGRIDAGKLELAGSIPTLGQYGTDNTAFAVAGVIGIVGIVGTIALIGLRKKRVN